MATREEEIAYLTGSIDGEIDLLMEKLPWGQVVFLSALIVLATAAYAAVCVPFFLGTLGAGAIPCIAAALTLTGAIINFLYNLSGYEDELAELEDKNARLGALLRQPAGEEPGGEAEGD